MSAANVSSERSKVVITTIVLKHMRAILKTHEYGDQDFRVYSIFLPKRNSFTLLILNLDQWCGGSEAAEEAARLMAPPPVIFFCLLVWDACHVVGTICNDRRSLRSTFGWMGAPQAPNSSMVESWWRFRGLALWKLQRICILWYLNLGLILPNNTWMIMHFFMCIAVQSHRKIPKVQNFQFSSFLSEKMCMFHSSSWIIFLKFKRQAI